MQPKVEGAKYRSRGTGPIGGGAVTTTRMQMPTRLRGSVRRGASAGSRAIAADVEANCQAAEGKEAQKECLQRRRGGCRRVASNPRRSIEDSRLKPLHHPGKQALLDPGRENFEYFELEN